MELALLLALVAIIVSFLMFWPTEKSEAEKETFGACCKHGSCTDVSGVDFLKAKAECESGGGTFIPFARCSKLPCPKTGACDMAEAPVKKTKTAKKSKPKKSKPGPNSSMKVDRKGARKKPRKNTDY